MDGTIPSFHDFIQRTFAYFLTNERSKLKNKFSNCLKILNIDFLSKKILNDCKFDYHLTSYCENIKIIKISKVFLRDDLG